MKTVRILKARPQAPRRLVCFPHAGGSASFYRDWGAGREDIEVLAVQYPGRADRLAEPAHGDLLELAEESAAALLPLLDGRPVTVVGHSMGAIVAFEAVRRIEAADGAVRRLVASAARAPHDPRHVSALGTEWDDEAAVRSIVAMGQTDAALMADPRVRELVLPYLRADFELFQRYAYQPATALSCEVLVVHGVEDDHVRAPQADLWRELTQGRFAHVVVPGGHFYLSPEPPLDLFLGELPVTADNSHVLSGS
ncbi:thioesterase II family protein [Streptomyces roseolus]|uniref:thioesterase II family protein n=1 Tax=Streptomyces roseolus TaxID=67358 RepID=UPI00167AD57A|nr:alpha/beta fold hydrolase [Streptomyces roseolus]GGR63147.1 thioesterase [Streptomyces roseolus]